MVNENRIPSSLLETAEWNGGGFKPLFEIGDYRVAMLGYFSGVSAENISRIERHNLTDEIFILTEGSAHLVLLKGDNKKPDSLVLPMRRNVAYNVKAGVWHHVLLSPDAHIIIFERADTSKENSDYFKPDPELVEKIRAKL